MAPISKTPTFNLKVVVQETGIKPDTLRAWERRYGLPQPDRTEGGHRLYSQYDIETLKWLLARREEGLSISRAVKLWRTMQAEGREPLQAMPYRSAGSQPAPTDLVSGGTLAEMRQSWLSACLAYDEARAEHILAQSFAIYPLETVCLELLLKGLAEIGELWYAGEVSVQQEHFASALALRRLDALLAAAPLPTRPGRILIGCPAGEEHTFSSLLLSLLLRLKGWDVVYLGANVPLERLERTLRLVRPGLVVLSSLQLSTAAALYEAAQFVREEGTTFAFGGRVFNRLPDLRRRIPGHFLGERLEEAVQTVEEILTRQPPPPAVEPVPERYKRALALFRERGELIIEQVRRQLQGGVLPEGIIALVNEHMTRDIEAALALGDMNLLGPELDWVSALVKNYQMSESLLPGYLESYGQAVRKHLAEDGSLVFAWLEQVEVNGFDKAVGGG